MSSPSDSPWIEELPSVDVMTAARALSDWPRLLLLDSSLRRAHVGRFSFLMADPVAHWELDHATFGSNPFAGILEQWSQCRGESIDGLPPFQGGIAGLLGYELGQSWERIASAPHDEFHIPVMAVGLYDWVIAWDHSTERVTLISHGWPEQDPAKRRKRAESRADSVKKALAAIPKPPALLPAKPTSLAKQFAVPGTNKVTSTFARDDYLRTVERVIEYIHAGDIFQANLSQRLLAPAQRPPVEQFDVLRQVNPAPFAGLMTWDDWAIMSASPERFLSVVDGEVETRPIKGTRQRLRAPEADLFTRDELRQSDKDQAENIMIVDLLRNDLSRVCEAGTIRVPQLCEVETYETVQHLVSEVRGQLRTNTTSWDLFRATFPGGSISGAPKVRAMQIIAELERTVRGPYCGSLFYVGFDGRTDSNLLIRSFVQRHGWLQCNVGGGIVAQSNPIAEYEETLTKADGMLRSL